MYGTEHKVIAISSSVLMLIPLVVARLATSTFISPASIYAAAWFSFTFFPLVILFHAPINPWAILYITASVIAFTISALPFNWRAARQRNKAKLRSALRFSSPLLIGTLYFSAGCSVIFSLLVLIQNGFTLDQVFLDLLSTSGQFAAQRGNEGMEYGLVGILGTFFTYLCPALGGLQAGSGKKGHFFLLSIAPSLLAMITQSSKLMFLIGMCLYLSGTVIAKIFANDFSAPRVRGGLKLVVGIALIPTLVLVSFVSRLGVTDLTNLGDAIDPLIYSINSYTLGQVYAFADFFAFTIQHPSASVYKNDYYSFGAYTFASIFDMLGMGKDFPPGMFEETAWYSNTFETNIFTVFRGLIYDFGVIGSLVFIFAFGLVSHFFAYRTLTEKNAWLACSAYMAIIVFILMGYLISVFVARYLFLNAAAIWVLLYVNEHVRTLSKYQPTLRGYMSKV